MGILGKVSAALVGAAAVMSVSVGVTEAAPAAPDPYSTKVNTTTVVTTPTPIRTHTRVEMTVEVTANHPTQPTGRVTLTLHAAPGGGGQSRAAAAGPDGWTRTIDYDGGSEQLLGPAFPQKGTWLVTAVFTPDDTATFRGSRDGWTFEVVSRGGGNGGDGDGDDNGGLLPDTGGPALLWLLLGVGLVGGGAGAVVVARRRREPAPAAA